MGINVAGARKSLYHSAGGVEKKIKHTTETTRSEKPWGESGFRGIHLLDACKQKKTDQEKGNS